MNTYEHQAVRAKTKMHMDSFQSPRGYRHGHPWVGYDHSASCKALICRSDATVVVHHTSVGWPDSDIDSE